MKKAGKYNPNRGIYYDNVRFCSIYIYIYIYIYISLKKKTKDRLI